MNFTTASRLNSLRAVEMIDALIKADALYLEEDDPNPEPAPLVKRCGCGRPISKNKQRCGACQDAKLREFAPTIRDEAHLEQVLRGIPDEERADILRRMKPHLTF